jgi:hypothetical protein
MKLVWLGSIALFIVLLLNALTPVPVQAQGGNEFISGYLRTDQSQVYNHTDYRVDLKAGVIPTNGVTQFDFTTAWLAVNVTQNEADSGFMQVGLLTRMDGLHWFALGFMEEVTCRRGEVWTPVFGGHGCMGYVGDIVGLNQWHRVESVKYTDDNFWIARVYNAAGYPYDVARFHVNVDRIYWAYSTFEQGFLLLNPHADGQFWFRLPQYFYNGWQNWPYSSPNPNQHNYIEAQARDGSGRAVDQSTSDYRYIDVDALIAQ